MFLWNHYLHWSLGQQCCDVRLMVCHALQQIYTFLEHSMGRQKGSSWTFCCQHPPQQLITWFTLLGRNRVVARTPLEPPPLHRAKNGKSLKPWLKLLTEALKPHTLNLPKPKTFRSETLEPWTLSPPSPKPQEIPNPQALNPKRQIVNSKAPRPQTLDPLSPKAPRQ